MTGFVFLRVRAHRLLLAAALLAVLLTTSVLAALTAFSGSVGDAALRHTLTNRSAASASLVVSAQVDQQNRQEREQAEQAARKAARETFGGLPVTVRKLESSGPYALPRDLQAPAARRGEPDLTHFAALDRSRVRLTAGRLPVATKGEGPVQVALPGVAAEILKLKPGSRLTLTDRLSETRQQVLITGLYEVSDQSDAYWQLDSLNGRGVRKVVFTTYGPLLTDPALLGSGRLSTGDTSWLATADFRTVTTDSMDALREASTNGPKALLATPVFKNSATARIGLPTVLDQTDRALLVARSTLMIVAVQLVLLAAYALLLVARLLSSERGGETELLRARGGSRGRITSFAAIEALMLAVPAAVIAPLLAGPLTRLLAERSELSRIGLRFGEATTGTVWLVAAAVALACALAVVAPALAASAGGGGRRTRAAALPGPVRAGADLGLLLIAAVAYWQLDRQTGGSGGGALSGDREGDLGIDPLLVAAPALALLAGTVLTLRLLPPAAKLAERRAASGRGLPAALAGWQFSRRPLRGAGPVLLLVLSVAMGMLAIGQSASWNRSQGDQADFRSGASVRMVGGLSGDPAKAATYLELPGVREAAPAYRTEVELSGQRMGQVIALDTGHADEGMLIRADLADGKPRQLFDAIAPAKTVRTGLLLPKGSERLTFDVRIDGRAAKKRAAGPPEPGPTVTVLLEDRYGLPHRILAGQIPIDGKPHTLSLPVAATAELAVTGFEIDDQPAGDRTRQRRFTVSGPAATTADGGQRPLRAQDGLRWQAVTTINELGEERPGPVPAEAKTSGDAPAFDYNTGISADGPSEYIPATSSLRIATVRPKAAPLKAVVTDAYLKAAGAKLGDEVDLNLAGNVVRVALVKSVRQLPTTGADADALTESGDSASRAKDGGGMLLDLRSVTALLAERAGATISPTEWWMSTDPGDSSKVAAALRELPDTDPAQVQVRDETAQDLVNDPLGAGPQSALLAVTVVAAALAAVGFAVSAAGSQRERSAEFAVLRALGAPRRRLARMIAAEQGVLITIALLVGLALGAALTRAVVPLIVLTRQAAQPVPEVLVQLPAGQVATLLAGVAALPLLTVAAIALRRADPAVSLRHQGDN
ncbi:ABC transporter permease [Streptomyces sp. NBC_00654]|uniref:ABC transporter permease n=1 Tax=Streptomyces sp. NBC_00654 TaxID=2975799 RepID=UPI00224DD89B|nr:ABC transporter permease [Streptomyces sp. NBC_00654]MCX4969341.1 ABC transporter permease [Streptomyces sp. NBC_00654]